MRLLRLRYYILWRRNIFLASTVCLLLVLQPYLTFLPLLLHIMLTLIFILVIRKVHDGMRYWTHQTCSMHEAGHTVIAWAEQGVDQIRFVTIAPPRAYLQVAFNENTPLEQRVQGAIMTRLASIAVEDRLNGFPSAACGGDLLLSLEAAKVMAHRKTEPETALLRALDEVTRRVDESWDDIEKVAIALRANKRYTLRSRSLRRILGPRPHKKIRSRV